MLMNKYKRLKCIKIFFAFLLIINCLTMGEIFKVFAAETREKSVALVSIPLEQFFLKDGQVKEEKDCIFQYELTALEKGNPMPDNTTGNLYIIEIPGSKNLNTKNITYSAGGIYNYKIKALPNNIFKNYVNHNDEYEVTVYIKNTVEGGLSPTVIIKNKDGLKVDRVSFSYTVNPEGTDDNTSSGGGNNTSSGGGNFSSSPNSGNSSSGGGNNTSSGGNFNSSPNSENFNSNGGNNTSSGDNFISSPNIGKVDTGDNTNMVPLIICFVVSAFIIILLIWKKEKNSKER